MSKLDFCNWFVSCLPDHVENVSGALIVTPISIDCESLFNKMKQSPHIHSYFLEFMRDYAINPQIILSQEAYDMFSSIVKDGQRESESLYQNINEDLLGEELNETPEQRILGMPLYIIFITLI
jgi:hypothetical protein